MEHELLVRGFEINWSRIEEESYLRGIPAISSLRGLRFSRPVTCFCGENGSGKSTLLEALALACGFNPEGGTVNYHFSTRDTHSSLHQAVRLIRGTRRPRTGYFLRSESFYNVASAEDEYSRGPGGCPLHLHEVSHGESFLRLARQAFVPGGLYLLDEPEAALSPSRQLTLLLLISRCAQGGAQFILATHSPILLGIPGCEILSFDEEVHPCSYEETESVRTYELFLGQRERLLTRLMEETTGREERENDL